MSPQTKTTIAAVLTGLVVTMVLDVVFDMPMLARWGVTLVVIVVVTTILTKGRERRARDRNDGHTFS